MLDEQTVDLIRKTAEELLSVLETPINDIPSVVVKNRANALRLIAASFKVVWNTVTEGKS